MIEYNPLLLDIFELVDLRTIDDICSIRSITTCVKHQNSILQGNVALEKYSDYLFSYLFDVVIVKSWRYFVSFDRPKKIEISIGIVVFGECNDGDVGSITCQSSCCISIFGITNNGFDTEFYHSPIGVVNNIVIDQVLWMNFCMVVRYKGLLYNLICKHRLVEADNKIGWFVHIHDIITKYEAAYSFCYIVFDTIINFCF